MSNKIRGLWAILADSLGDSAGYGTPWTTSYAVCPVTGMLHRVICQHNLWESIHPFPLVLANEYTSQHDLDGRVQPLSLVICLWMVWSRLERYCQIQKLVPTISARSCHISMLR